MSAASRPNHFHFLPPLSSSILVFISGLLRSYLVFHVCGYLVPLSHRFHGGDLLRGPRHGSIVSHWFGLETIALHCVLFAFRRKLSDLSLGSTDYYDCLLKKEDLSNHVLSRHPLH